MRDTIEECVAYYQLYIGEGRGPSEDWNGKEVTLQSIRARLDADEDAQKEFENITRDNPLFQEWELTWTLEYNADTSRSFTVGESVVINDVELPVHYVANLRPANRRR